MGVDNGRFGKELPQGKQFEDTHALAFHAKFPTSRQLRQGSGGGRESVHVARLVSPVAHGAGKIQGIERSHFQIWDNRHGILVPCDDHNQGTFHKMEITTKNTPEIRPGYEGDRIQPGGVYYIEYWPEPHISHGNQQAGKMPGRMYRPGECR